MAMRKGIDKWKSKKWFSVYAPSVFEKKSVGEIPANNEKNVVGRNVKLTLSDLTGSPEHSYTNVILKVIEAKGNAANTKLERIELPYSYIKSLAKKFRSVVDVIIPITTSDGVKSVIKLFAVTERRIAHAKVKELRKQLSEFTVEYFSNKTADESVKSIVEKKYQTEAAAKVRNISILRNLEVRKLEFH